MNEPEVRVSPMMRDESQKSRISRLKRRPDFQRAARGRRTRMEAFALQANRRAGTDRPPDRLGPRLGFTVTKKVGGAVLRNRIRRRLKEAMRLARDLEARPDHDYVVMAQRETLARRFDLLQADLIRAFSLVHSSAARSAPTRQSNDRDKRR